MPSLRLRPNGALLILVCSLLARFSLVVGATAEPQVDFLAPGFTVQRLPVRLSNIDNVEYGPDGKLYAAGYDGRVHVLSDTDGDGLEDTATVFWDKPGDLLTPVGMVVTREGVYVAARGKIALLRDADGDGRADVSEAVATDWKSEHHNNANRNDASGVAIDRAGNLYFSLGCSDYSNPFLVDKDGVAHYSLASERGTILKVSPDRQRREIYVTGIRFGISLQFNQHGDLFATDQEGDTWFPGGNPLDELLHIQQGRHYGFPFRHPERLPNVIDEPSIVDFGPQHQSTCGFRFNEPATGRKAFGPKALEGDAFVTGFARGKLWRTTLVKTSAGYVGQPTLFASFNSLPTDVALSPQGALLVSAHSGWPDWGAGPQAEGHLFKLVYADNQAPQPVVAWAQSPLEVRVAFDRPINADLLKDVKIQAGEFVREGDRYETIRPGYKVVQEQQVSPRHDLKVQRAELLADGRTVRLTVAPHPWQAHYAIVLEGVSAKRAKSPTYPADLSYTLNGVEASWTANRKTNAEWQGWLPHLESVVNQSLVGQSAAHEDLFSRWRKKGTLNLRTQITLPGKVATVRFKATHPVFVQGETLLERTFAVDKKSGTFQLKGGEPALVELAMQTQSGTPRLELSYHTDADPHERPLPLHAMLVPWAPVVKPGKPETKGTNTFPFTGDVKRGRDIFFGEQAKCSTCHAFQGQGGKVGPDLTPSLERDPAAVLRDILQPNAAINPDFVSVNLELKNGETLSGIVQAQDTVSVTLLDTQAAHHSVSRKDILHLRSSAVSLMPEGLDALGEQALQDLLAYLCRKEGR